VPFKAFLKEIVSSVSGARGAIIIEGDGEAVQWFAPLEADRLRLRAAYLSVLLQAQRTAMSKLGLGAMSCLVVSYDRVRFVICDLGADSVLVVELDAGANVGASVHNLQKRLPELKAGIGG
jgi:predicted regulator of Ras-like GTPase activity (Roadblock/LC7/MglB family)